MVSNRVNVVKAEASIPVVVVEKYLWMSPSHKIDCENIMALEKPPNK